MTEEAKNPAVSVIIPAYRASEYIAETLNSILAQTFTDYEIIVINDGCPETEALERVLEPFRDKIVYLKKENGGVSSARNAGFRASRAPLVALLDADDAWEPDYLEYQVGILNADPTVDVVYPNSLLFGDTPFAGKRGMDFSPSRGEVSFEALVSFRCMVTVSVTARKEVLQRAGCFDESFRRAEDFDLWLRVVKGGGRIVYHDKPLMRYRRRRNGLSSDGVAMRQAAIAVLEKAERTMVLAPDEQKAIDDAKIRFQADTDYFAGWRAARQGDIAEATRRLQSAQRYFRGRKLSLFLFALKTMPGVATTIARRLDRLE